MKNIKGLTTKGLLFLFIISTNSCLFEHKKLYIKTVDIKKRMRLHWYYYSYFDSDSEDFVEIEKNGVTKKILESETLTDIKYSNDTIIFQVERLSYRQDRISFYYLDSNYLKRLGYKYRIDTIGPFWNDKNNRLGRLFQTNTDITKPHYTNSDSKD